MRSKQLTVDGHRVLLLVLDKGDETMSAISGAVERHRVRAAQVTAVGAFQSARRN